MTRNEKRRKGRTRWFVASAVMIVALGTTFVVVLTRASSATPVKEATPPAVQTAEVVTTDLSEEEEADGTLGYGDESTVAGQKQGTITSLPAAGTTLTRCKPVYGVDAKPVPLFYGTLPFYRELAEGVDNGDDVKQLEENLKACGFGGFGTPDKKFTAATTAALKKFQKSLGQEQTGHFGQGDVVLTAGEVRVSSVTAKPGSPASGEILKTTGTRRSVQVKLDATKQDLAVVGAKASIVIQGKSTTGTITDVGRSAQEGKDPAGQDDGKPKIVVTVKLDDPAAGGSFDSAPANVRFTKSVHKAVLTVPVGALLALAEGGYAVEVDENGKRSLIAVQTGLFQGGKVEVAGAGLKAGMRVVTTS